MWIWAVPKLCKNSGKGVIDMKRLTAAVCVFLAGLVAEGCQRSGPGPTIMHRPPAPVTARRMTMGNSIEARPIECVIVG